jgi:hypothetical protein
MTEEQPRQPQNSPHGSLTEAQLAMAKVVGMALAEKWSREAQKRTTSPKAGISGSQKQVR